MKGRHWRPTTDRGYLRDERRTKSWITATLFLLLVASGCTEKVTPPAAKTTFDAAPVVIVSIDTLRSDHLPAYGYEGVSTPSLDAFRNESTLFERAYSPSPMTLPSHTSMLTGLLPASHGVRNNVGYTFDRTMHAFLPCALRERGYRTGAMVSTYVLRRETGLDACFDLYEDSIDPRGGHGRFTAQQRPGKETLDAAVAWLDTTGSSPFFLFFHIYEPHVPYDPPEPYRSLYEPYDGEIALADEIVGELVSALRSIDAWDRSLVIITSDHGEGLGDHGEEQHSVLLNRELIQVPLMIKRPGGIGAGSTIRVPVQLTDLTPTILELIGANVPAGLDGEPILSDRASPDRPLFTETLYPRIHLGWSDLASLVRGRYHYIDGPSPALYDLQSDPREQTNLIDSERRTAASMREAITPFRVPMSPIGPVDSETARRLTALGYVGSPLERTGPLPDPAEHIHDLEKIREALLLGRTGHAREAELILRELLVANPGMVEAWTSLARVLSDAGDHPASADAYQRALKHSHVAVPDLVLEAGFEALAAGRIDTAVAMAESAGSSLPRNAAALMARIELTRGRPALAEEAARTAQHDPPRPSDLVLIAETIQSQGRLPEALELLEAAETRARSEGSLPIYGLNALRADCLARTGKIEDAEAAFRREIDDFPENLQSWARLAALRFLAGDRPGARALLDQMVRQNPGRTARRLAAETLEVFEGTRGPSQQ